MKSHDSASSVPPPSANPFTAAITGLERFSMEVNTLCPRRPKSLPPMALRGFISEMSAPATNAFPVPVRMITFTSSFPSISQNASLSSFRVSVFRAFRTWGLLIVIVAIPSVISTSKFS